MQARFAGFAPTKAARRILPGDGAGSVPGVHVAYLVIDAVVDLGWTHGCSRGAERVLHQTRGDRRRSVTSLIRTLRLVVSTSRSDLSEGLVTDRSKRRAGIEERMSDLDFSYLPNPRIWKATITARLCGRRRVRGAAEGAGVVAVDFDARPLGAGDRRWRPRAHRSDQPRR